MKESDIDLEGIAPVLAHCRNNFLSVEILSGGESEGGSVEETVCQETQTPRVVSNSHGDVDKSVVRSIKISNLRLIVRLPCNRGFIRTFSAGMQLVFPNIQDVLN